MKKNQGAILRHHLRTAMWAVVRTSETHNRAAEAHRAWAERWTVRVSEAPTPDAVLELRDEADARSNDLGKTMRPKIEAEARFMAITDLVADLFEEEEP
jgi:hypothetical protein